LGDVVFWVDMLKNEGLCLSTQCVFFLRLKLKRELNALLPAHVGLETSASEYSNRDFFLRLIARGLFMLDNVKIAGMAREAYFVAVELGDDLRLEADDALAVGVMWLNGVTEVCSFDEDFDRVEGMTRLPVL
jgi:predicted nucleic acid-binding protein